MENDPCQHLIEHQPCVATAGPPVLPDGELSRPQAAQDDLWEAAERFAAADEARGYRKSVVFLTVAAVGLQVVAATTFVGVYLLTHRASADADVVVAYFGFAAAETLGSFRIVMRSLFAVPRQQRSDHLPLRRVAANRRPSCPCKRCDPNPQSAKQNCELLHQFSARRDKSP